jgi:hypothetical protein
MKKLNPSNMYLNKESSTLGIQKLFAPQKTAPTDFTENQLIFLYKIQNLEKRK